MGEFTPELADIFSLGITFLRFVLDIPESEIQYVDATGLYIWKPGVNKTFETWSPGKHVIRITWDTITGLPDYGEYSWEFTTY